MKILNGQDLIDAGWGPGPIIGEMLVRIKEYEARGITDAKYILKLLKRDFVTPPPKMPMREKARSIFRSHPPGNQGGKRKCRLCA